jgi:HSP20 family protein
MLTVRNGRGLSVWEPFSDLQLIQDEMDRLFPTYWPKDQNGNSKWRPSLEVHEEADKFVVKAEVPGVKKEDVSISLLEDTLTIKGERKLEHEEKKENYLLFEGTYGSFHRTVQLPRAVKVDAVKAEYKDGILEIQLPKAEEAKTKEIKINVK